MSYAARLDSQQRHMVSLLMQVRPREDESFDAFAHRRRIYCGKLASKHGRWSQLWANSVRNWREHVSRRHDVNCWSGPVLDWHGAVRAFGFQGQIKMLPQVPITD